MSNDISREVTHAMRAATGRAFCQYCRIDKPTSEQSGQESVLRDEIIRMAREAGLSVGTNISGIVLVGSPAEIGLNHLTIDELERFAALVAAAEREACADFLEHGFIDDDDHHLLYAREIRARGAA